MEQQVVELLARLSQNSTNSSTPPSADPPSTPAPAGRAPTGRRRGGQAGHDKHERTLVPPEQVTQVHQVVPRTCQDCGGALGGSDPVPVIHQVTELPPVTPIVQEYRLHALCCAACGATTRAPLPPGVPSGQFGPRLQATVAVCTGAYRLSKRAVQQMLADFFDVHLSLGSIPKLEQQTSEALCVPVAEVGQAVKEAAIVHADETGWYVRAKRAWLWVAATCQLACFLVRPGRGAQVAKELLGKDFGGMLVSDRWSGYGWVPVAQRQLCWAHLIRQFVGFKDYGGAAAQLSAHLERNVKEMFRLWHRVREGTLRRRSFQRQMKPIEQAVGAYLRVCAALPVQKVAGRAKEILQLEPALWTFVHHEGIEPTNNHAERLVRHGVLWRKSSFGTDSESGSRFVERILTTVATLRLQQRNVLDYVEHACRAALAGQPPASLLPPAATHPAAALAA